MRMNKILKMMTAGLMVAAVVVAGTYILPIQTYAAEVSEMADGDKVCYDAMTGEEFENLYITNNKKAPVKEGYLFGGWYEDEGVTPITADTASAAANRDTVYAKFVPAYVLSVKAQNYASTAASENGIPSADKKTTTRVVSTVDASLQYSEIGFSVVANNKEFEISTSKVWKKLGVGNQAYDAKTLYGTVSEYFFVLNVENIPETKWGDAIYARPYWVTVDGTQVEGLGKYVYVEDGLKGYISVPVNLNNVTAGIAAGVLEVDYDETKLQYVECATGRVFAEMDAADKVTADNNKYVRCVGNVETPENVTKDDMYITLRFKVITGETLTDREAPYQFVVSAEDFANKDEKEINLNVWNVQY